jgi:hypothetical protein
MAVLVALLASRAGALEVLRLPWIFSDKPQLTADFNFSPQGRQKASAGLTHVELALGGRFSHFGLPRGAAKAPELTVRCEFVSPGELVSRVATLESKVDLSEVLAESGLKFERRHFSASSRLVFKTEFTVNVAPGDYNVVVSIADKELSIFSSRTLHVIVPDMAASRPALSDLKFCLGVGQELDKQGKPRRVLDSNPWRQVGGRSGWELIVAYSALGPSLGPRLMRRVSVRKLRGEGSEKPLWQEESKAPEKSQEQLYLARVAPKVVQGLNRGIYVLKVELWPENRPLSVLASSKTFEVLQP